MAFLTEEGAEPIPGYRLVQRLGSGGYGEVWKVTAPGGLYKAIKIVYGHMNEMRAEQELKALSRMKEVRHPFLLSLERFEVISDQLFIITELADKSLMDRFEECRRSGLYGIPRDEMLGYLRDAADVLDHMHEDYGLQHLDIKPQNILLVSGRVKIADFGLVKELSGNSATATSGVTPVYAPPEAFDGRVSRNSDQYSLGVVYQEMLTGIRPFPGTTALQLAAQHATSPPMLTPLPPQDRPVIARALAKLSNQRFTSCRELVEGLLRAGTPAAPAPAPVRPPAEAVPPPITPPDIGEAPTGVAERPPAEPVWEPLPGETGLRTQFVGPSRQTAQPVLRPTLFLGVGGLAAWVLRHLKYRLAERFGDPAAVPLLRLLLLDADRAALRQAQEGRAEEALVGEELLPLPLRRPEEYRDRSRELFRWLDRRWLYGIPRSLQTKGMRPLGRLALVDHAADVVARLHEALALLTAPEAREAARKATGIGLREEAPRVFLIGSVSGGTGGMLLDLAYAVRGVLAGLGVSEEGLCAVLLHATSPTPEKKKLARANAHAALTELHHFLRPDSRYPGDPGNCLPPSAAGVPPFPECYLVHLGDDVDENAAEAAADTLAEYLYRDAATPLGHFLDQHRQTTTAQPSGAGGGGALRTFGLCHLRFPRDRLVRLAADLFSARLVHRWRGDRKEHPEQEIEQEARRQAAGLGLEPEALNQRFRAALEAAWGMDAEAHLRKTLTEIVRNPPAPGPEGPGVQFLNAIDRQLATQHGPGGTDTLVGTALHAQAAEIGDVLGDAVRKWLLSLAEDPLWRLQAAEDSCRWLLEHLGSLANRAHEKLLHIRQLAHDVRDRLETEALGGGGGWRGLWRRQDAGGEGEKYLEYCWAKYEELVWESTEEALRASSKQVSAFKYEVVACRQNLADFAEAFRPDPGVLHELVTGPNRLDLLPGGATDLLQAAEELVAGLPPHYVLEFAQMIQTEVLGPRGGVWGFVGGIGESGREIQSEMQRRARKALLGTVHDVDAARLFLEAHATLDEAREAAAELLAQARPRLGADEGWQHLVLGLPNSRAAATLRDLVVGLVAGTPVNVVDTDTDVILCWESAHLSYGQAAALLADHERLPADLIQQVLTRVDVPWSPLPEASR